MHWKDLLPQLTLVVTPYFFCFPVHSCLKGTGLTQNLQPSMKRLNASCDFCPKKFCSPGQYAKHAFTRHKDKVRFNKNGFTFVNCNVSTKIRAGCSVTWGQFHKLFCAKNRSFMPYAELLRHKKASQKLGVERNYLRVGRKLVKEINPRTQDWVTFCQLGIDCHFGLGLADLLS